MSTSPKRITTGAQYLALLNTVHPLAPICPGCDVQCDKKPLLQLVWTFEPCDPRETGCTLVEFEHHAERLWHKVCFVAASAEMGLKKKETPDVGR